MNRTGDTPESLPDLEEIIHEMEKNVPGTFEYAYTRFVHSNRREEQIEFLKKSYELSPDHE
jgi:hypothetical protein